MMQGIAAVIARPFRAVSSHFAERRRIADELVARGLCAECGEEPVQSGGRVCTTCWAYGVAP